MSIISRLILLFNHSSLPPPNQAPFLGLSAAAVNIHNVLLCISTLMKEVKQEDGETATLNIQQLYKSNSSKDGRRRNKKLVVLGDQKTELVSGPFG